MSLTLMKGYAPAWCPCSAGGNAAPARNSQRSPSVARRQSLVISVRATSRGIPEATALATFSLASMLKALQVGVDCRVKPRGLGLLLAQACNEPLHLFLEELAIVLGGLRTDIPP